MQNTTIDEKFFRPYLTDEAIQATDFSTLQKHDIHLPFLEKIEMRSEND